MAMLDTFNGAELQFYGEMLHRHLTRTFEAATAIFSRLPAVKDSGEYDRLWLEAAALMAAGYDLKNAHDEVIAERRARRAGAKPGEHYAGQHALEAAQAARRHPWDAGEGSRELSGPGRDALRAAIAEEDAIINATEFVSQDL